MRTISGASVAASTCVDANRRFGGAPPNFGTLHLGHIEVDSADFWTNRWLSSSSRSTAESLASKRSHTRTSKSGCRFAFRAERRGAVLGRQARRVAREPRAHVVLEAPFHLVLHDAELGYY